MKLSRLRGRKVCLLLQKKGMLWKGRTMLIRWLPSAPKHPSIDPRTPGIYAGTLASTKLDKSAVKRNRMRRRCREALRVALHAYALSGSIQLLIMPRSSSLDAPFTDIQRDIRTFLTTATHGRLSQAQ